MINDILLLVFSLYLVIKGATLSTKYAVRLAEAFRLSKYVIGLIVVAVISILPETFIAINSAIKGVPDFGLGTLFGSNVADMTLLFAVVIFLAGRGVRISGKIMKNNVIYLSLIILPLILGLDGHYSRLDGMVLVISGVLFYYLAFRKNTDGVFLAPHKKGKSKSFVYLILSMAMLLAGSYFTVTSATSLARDFGLSEILIGMLVVGLGTIMPELFFALKSVKNHSDSMAVGDVLGTVLADATVVVGILAMINPFDFPRTIIYVTGVFMLSSALILFYFMRSGRIITKKEGILLFIWWVLFVSVEYLIGR